MSREITKSNLQGSIHYPSLVEQLKLAFSQEQYTFPERLHLELSHSNVALVMPAWNNKYYGVKQILACPGNSKHGLPTIQGKYDLFDVKNGQALASIDAAELTAVRTAATSVLASSYFVNEPRKLVILGNGVIAQHLSEAYNACYNLQETVIWTRSLSSKIDLEKELQNADIISCATLAYEPILYGKWVKGSPHIDLVGSYKPDMREADDNIIANAEIYIDDWPAIKESGDLAIPLHAKTIEKRDIKGTLFDLCRNEVVPLTSNRPTLFKSVGHAIEDLAAAIYFYEKSK